MQSYNHSSEAPLQIYPYILHFFRVFASPHPKYANYMGIYETF